MKLLVTFCWTLGLIFIGSSLAQAAPILALAESNKLIRFESTSPNFIQSRTTVTGLQPGEILLVIDFRPSTGQLYGVTDASRLYVINPTTGAATQVGSGSFSPALDLGGIRGLAVDLGFDFDPVADQIRVVTITGQNLRLNPDTGLVVGVDSALAFASGDPNAGRADLVSAAAYSNNVAGATSTTLYTIVNGNGSGFPPTVLATQGSPGGSPVSANAGQLFTVGTIGLVYIEPTGLDIAPDGTAYALLTSTDTLNQFFTINLATGAASHFAGIGPEFVRDLAVVLPNSVPPAGTFQFDATSYSVNEDANFVTVTVTRTGDTTVAAAVDLTTVDDSAEQRSDYIIALRKLAFGPGETSKSVKILIVDDVFVEPLETFNVFLSNATAGFLPGSPNPAAVTIVSNDPITVQPLPNPLGDAQFFVRQHYFDFLNREPDAAGLDFWVNQITSCGTNQQCIDLRRINVSAAFFLSIEFQSTGTLAYLTEKAAFSGLPRYRAFMRDVQALQKDYVFGAPGAGVQLEANKQAFFDDFVARPEFLTRYAGTTNEQYVFTLFANAGLATTTAELYIARLNGAQVVPPSGSPATGLIVLRQAINTPAVAVSLSFSGLTSAETEAHIHGPAAADANAPAIVTLPSGQFVDFQTPLTNPQLRDLSRGMFYVDVHTSSFPNGEIRGQLPPNRFVTDMIVRSLDAGIITRAQALRLVAESDYFRISEFNRAFVMMEYFGYLRRNPDDPPDNNLAGFSFWLTKLNQFNGNFVNADMVKAFIKSTEYRGRFGLP
jgi:Domain of unknown function (DUF4394)/CHRD domain/Calx-beta domain/Domain of unknown function (DUF4214)